MKSTVCPLRAVSSAGSRPLQVPSQAVGGGGSWPPRGSLGTPSLPFSPAFGTIDKMFIPPPAHMLFAVMTVISGANAAFSRRQSIRLITAWEAGLFKFKW